MKSMTILDPTKIQIAFIYFDGKLLFNRDILKIEPEYFIQLLLNIINSSYKTHFKNSKI